ncbi:MAG TPA: glycoside hydrolase family 20 zincin-like fold domain-containing protein [Armatimonadota bacterium]|jgi:hypothetical protein
MLRFALAALLCSGALSVIPAFAAGPAPLADLSAGHLRFSLSKSSGMELTVRGVPFIRESTFYIVKPGWTGAYLNQDKDDPEVTTSSEGRTKVATATFDKLNAYAKYRFEVRPDDTFKVTLTFASKGPESVVEYDAGYLNANILQGAKFTAETVKGKVSGVVPLFAKSADQVESKLAPNMSHAVFETAFGRIEMTVEGTSDITKSLTLFDARKGGQDWARKNPIFWLGIGVPAPALPPGEHTITITWKFGEPAQRTVVASAAGKAKVVPVKVAQSPFVVETPVIPRPKEMKPGKALAPFRVMPGKTRILISDTASEEEIQGARELVAEFKEFWSVPVRIEKVNVATWSGETDNDAIELFLGSALLPPPRSGEVERVRHIRETLSHPESYFMGSQLGGVAVLGGDPHGVYYGVQTLKQLIRVDAKGVYIKPVEISDWPSLSMRGVHWFGGPDAWPFHKKMIDRVLSAFKMNTMVFQCDYTQWATQPKIWSSERSSTKADVKKAVDYARAHFIEPIPLVNTLGHSEWLFWNNQNLDICADPSKPFAYDPENPKTYEIVMPIMQEAVDLFQPKYFHIGHDEVTMSGQFPKAGSKKTAGELILADTNKMHDWLAAKGIKTMMWGDMLLHETEVTDAGLAPTKADAVARRAGVPKDTIIADWHYQGSDPAFPSVAILQKDGFQVLGTTWYDWGNIQNFSRVLNKEKSLGFLQSTWAGYNMFPDIVKGDSFNQFVAYLLGAEYAWNGGKPNVADLGYRPDDAFLAVWDRRPVSMVKRAGFTVDFGVPSSESRVPSTIPELGTRKSEPMALSGITFRQSTPIWLDGALNPPGEWPKSVTITLNRKAADLHFLWGATFAAAKDTPVATLKVTYTDGATVQAPIAYGRQIFAFTDAQAGPQTTTAWTGTTPRGQSASVRRWMWTNPNPAKAIKSVTLSSAQSEAAPVLLGLTGIE